MLFLVLFLWLNFVGFFAFSCTHYSTTFLITTTFWKTFFIFVENFVKPRSFSCRPLWSRRSSSLAPLWGDHLTPRPTVNQFTLTDNCSTYICSIIMLTHDWHYLFTFSCHLVFNSFTVGSRVKLCILIVLIYGNIIPPFLALRQLFLYNITPFTWQGKTYTI